MGSHSLRIGGATSLYHAVKDLEAVKRYGRWTTDCYHIYLWEDHERQRDFAQGMARGRQLLAQSATHGSGDSGYGGVDASTWAWAVQRPGPSGERPLLRRARPRRS